MKKKNNFFCCKNIPNILTIFRIFIVFIIIIFFVFLENVLNKQIYSYKILNTEIFFSQCLFISGILFVIACITDFLDGFIARKYKYISDFGKFWDPLADKILINTILILFAWKTYIPVWVPILMIARDCIVDGNRMICSKKGIVIQANIYGKLKTNFQMFAIIIIFFIFCVKENENEIIYYAIQNIFIYFALFFSLLSGFIYLKKKN